MNPREFFQTLAPPLSLILRKVFIRLGLALDLACKLLIIKGFMRKVLD
jgi:hypothetical protein